MSENDIIRMYEDDILRKVKLLREVQRMIEDAQAEAKALIEDIRDFMGDSQEVSIGGYRITQKCETAAKNGLTALRIA